MLPQSWLRQTGTTGTGCFASRRMRSNPRRNGSIAPPPRDNAPSGNRQTHSPASRAAVICLSDLTSCFGPPSPSIRIESVTPRNHLNRRFFFHPAQATNRTFRGQTAQISIQSM
jgi:hypothetical protein